MPRLAIDTFIVFVQSRICVQLFATPWTLRLWTPWTHQASLSFTISWSLLKFMSIELVMLSNHLILCHPLLLLPSMRLKSLSWRIPNLYFLSLWVSAWVSGFQSGASGKESACNAGDTGDASSVSRLRRFSGGRNGNSPLYSCLENLMDRGAWPATDTMQEFQPIFKSMMLPVSSTADMNMSISFLKMCWKLWEISHIQFLLPRVSQSSLLCCTLQLWLSSAFLESYSVFSL